MQKVRNAIRMILPQEPDQYLLFKGKSLLKMGWGSGGREGIFSSEKFLPCPQEPRAITPDKRFACLLLVGISV
ncbi:MAG: hypothetical protein IKP40_04715 [Clostridia bacterium]|nr:hypothetical protein [Clostridia bacterium]